jgi:hypothetical protein
MKINKSLLLRILGFEIRELFLCRHGVGRPILESKEDGLRERKGLF